MVNRRPGRFSEWCQFGFAEANDIPCLHFELAHVGDRVASGKTMENPAGRPVNWLAEVNPNAVRRKDFTPRVSSISGNIHRWSRPGQNDARVGLDVGDAA